MAEDILIPDWGYIGNSFTISWDSHLDCRLKKKYAGDWHIVRIWLADQDRSLDPRSNVMIVARQDITGLEHTFSLRFICEYGGEKK